MNIRTIEQNGTVTAIAGDYPQHQSKPLRDFIYENSSGRDMFFAGAGEDAARRLSRA